MRLFAIADLHLSGGDDKPMTVFGEQWTNHFARISEDWISRVGPEDAVLIPGDISWAMQLEGAGPDLEAIGRLPGCKVLLRGNHDYWWSTVTKVRTVLPEGMKALQNDAVMLDSCVVCGTRGWNIGTAEEPLSPEDERICHREVGRLEMSLEAGMRLRGDTGLPLVVMTHFPPLYNGQTDTVFTEVLDRYPVSQVVYGHLHGAGIRSAYREVRKGVPYRLVSCDALNFRLEEVELFPSRDE